MSRLGTLDYDEPDIDSEGKRKLKIWAKLKSGIAAIIP